MAEYIEREAAIESLPVPWDSAVNALRNMPAADVAQVVHGEWVEDIDDMKCSVCKERWNYCDNDTYRFVFCPNCGAKMDGVVTMTDDCKWMQDEICVNADCPMCADYCPVADNPGVCRFEERGDSDAQKDKR